MNQTESKDSNKETIYEFIVSNFEALGILIAEQQVDELKICKIPKHINIKRITLPQEIKEIKPLSKRKFGQVQEHVSIFFETLNSAYPKEYLKNLYNNLNSLKIKEKRVKLFAISGNYSKRRNLIKCNENSIYHELMHMASNSIDRKHCGFFYSPHIGTYIGGGLNEGYTELLTARHFNNNKVTCYSYESEVASIIESIIGPRMVELYFDSNLLGLIEELKKYSNEDESMQFITNLDSLSTGFSINDAYDQYIRKPLVKEIYNYLVKIYFVFLKTQLHEKKITEEKCCELQNEFLDSYELAKYYSLDYVNALKETLNNQKTIK